MMSDTDDGQNTRTGKLCPIYGCLELLDPDNVSSFNHIFEHKHIEITTALVLLLDDD